MILPIGYPREDCVPGPMHDKRNQSMRLYLMRNIHRGIIMELLIKQLEELISPNEWCVTNLSNASALLMDAIDDLSWVGFYMMRAGNLS